MSYIKPLNASIGPKQTKCELTDETLHMDFNEYVCTMTTTRNPDVPSGTVFSVKTRTCIMWGGGMHAKVLVTTTVEWTGRSFIRGTSVAPLGLNHTCKYSHSQPFLYSAIIDRSAMEGQRVYHADLERAMRAYINEHRTEFVPDGEEEGAVQSIEAVAETPSSPMSLHHPRSPEDEKLERLKDTERRGLQWALDPLTGAGNVARQSFWGAIDLLGDLAESAPAGNIWLWLVLLLVVSNVWTLVSLRQANKREDMTRRRGPVGRGYGSVGGRGTEEMEREIAAEAVRAFLDGITKQREWAVPEVDLGGESMGSVKQEVMKLQQAVDAIDVQIGRIKERLDFLNTDEGAGPEVPVD